MAYTAPCAWKPSLVVGVLAFAVHAWSLTFGFSRIDDDILVIDRAGFLADRSHLPVVFSQGYFPSEHDSPHNYRPLVTLAYMLDARTPLTPAPYHRPNILLHVVASLLFLAVVRRRGFSDRVSVLGSACSRRRCSPRTRPSRTPSTEYPAATIRSSRVLTRGLPLHCHVLTRRDLYSLRLRLAPFPLKKRKEGRFGLKFVTSPFGLGLSDGVRIPQRGIVRRQSVSRETLEVSRSMRRDMTSAEKLLWSRLRRRAVAGMKFRREQPISGFHSDFYCDRAGVVVEVDGGVHEARRERDAERPAVIEGRALLVIRFTNDQVMNDVDAVCREIIATCLRRRARARGG